MISYFKAALVLFIIGTAIGLGIGWILMPVQITNADPADLRSSYKDDYVRMISAAFQLDRNVSRASLRLSQLGLGTPSQVVNDFWTRENKQGKSASDLAAVADLARALTAVSSARPTTLPTVASGKAIAVSAPNSTTETLALYRLVERTPLTCADEPNQAYLRFIVRDANGLDMPNVAIQVSSEKSEDTIYTGLKPERGVGYADLVVTPNTYAASVLGARGESVTQLQIADPANCGSDRTATRGWRVVFQKQ